MHFAVDIGQREIRRFERVQTIAMRVACFAEEPHCVGVVRDRLAKMPTERPKVERLISANEFVVTERRNRYANRALANPFRLEFLAGCAIKVLERQPQVIALPGRTRDLRDFVSVYYGRWHIFGPSPINHNRSSLIAEPEFFRQLYRPN